MLASNRKYLSFVVLFLLCCVLAPVTESYAAITATVRSLTGTGQVVVVDASTVIFGINAQANAGEDAVLNSVQVDVFDDEYTCPFPLPDDDGDPDIIAPADFFSFTVYRDDGTVDGVFDEDDTPVTPAAGSPFSAAQRDDCGIRFTAIMGSYSVDVPPDDIGPSAGDDYFVVVKMSAGVQVGDDFFLRIAEEQVDILNRDTSQLAEFPLLGEGDVDSDVLTVIASPTVTINVTSLVSPGQGILPRSGPTEVFAINAKGPEDTTFELAQVTVRIDDFGEEYDEGLYEVTMSDFASFQIYRDDGGREGIYDPPNGEELPDTLVAQEAVLPFPFYTPFYITVTVAPGNPLAQFPIDDVEANLGADFFVVIRTSDTIDSDFNLEGLNQIDDFTLTLEPEAIVARPVGGGLDVYFPAEDAEEIVTEAIIPEALALDLQPLPMDREVYDTRFILYPGDPEDMPNDRFRYHYFVPGQSMRQRFLGERDVEFTGLSQDTMEVATHSFAQPLVMTVERRHDLIGLDIAGGTANNPEFLAGLTITLSNLGTFFQSLREFDPLFGVDPIIGAASQTYIRQLFFSGIAVYEDTNNNGVYDGPPSDGNFNPDSFDQPLEFYEAGSYPYFWNLDQTNYMLHIAFTFDDETLQQLDLTADGKSDFFIVLRLDSGNGDDSSGVGDGTSVNFGADFKVSLERDELGVDLNGDGLVQPAPVQFLHATPRNGLVILAESPDPLTYLEVRKSQAIINGQDLSLEFFVCGCSPVGQRIDATSAPTALLALNMATSDVPQLDLIEEPSKVTDIRLNFSGEGFEPTDIAQVFLARDDKSPYNDLGVRFVGVFDIFNDLWNLPPPGSSFGATTNPAEDSPIPLAPWEWQNDGLVDYIVMYPASDLFKVRLYPDDELDATIDAFTDNYETINSDQDPSVPLPRDKVFAGADYFVVIETSDMIAYDDEIKVEIPRRGLATDNRPSVFEGVNLFNPESRSSTIQSVRANVPVELNNLVGTGQEIGPSSDYTAVIGLNMYTNNPGVDVYFEQLVVTFLQYGTRDSFNMASDLRPFENYNGENTAQSGIQLYRDANGNGEFDKEIDHLVFMDDTSATLGPNPSRVGLLGDEPNQVLMVFSSEENRQLVPTYDTNAGNDFFVVIRTSAAYNYFEDNFSVAILNWGPDTPAAPAPHTIIAGENSPYDAINFYQWFPWGRRSIGFVDSNGVRTRSTETINTNVFNATRSTWLDAVEDFMGTLGPQVTDPTRQTLLTWTDTNSDNPDSTYINENESGYWVESDIFGMFQPLPNPLLGADVTELFFDGPAFLAGRTIHFRIMPYRNNILGNPLFPPFNGPGPIATTAVTFWPSGNALPIAHFLASETSGCAPLTVCFVDASLQEPTGLSWNFGDGSLSVTGSSVCHEFGQAGIYEVCLTATNSYGSDTYCATITVSADPVAEFTSNSVNTCADQPVQFSDLSTGNPHTFLWDFGDGSFDETNSLANPAHSYTVGGTYTVTLTVSNDCSTSLPEIKSNYITVTSGLIADFSYSPIDGCAPVTIQFTDGSTCETIEWAWNFGDGTTSIEQNPQHPYAQPGLYTVCLTAGNGITTDEDCDSVRIYSCTPEIILSTNSLANSCRVGTNAPQQTFTVRNGGLNTLTYSVGDNVSWLAVSPLAGSSTGEADTITLTYYTARMPAGTYNARVTVAAAAAWNSPQYVNVTVVIGSTGLTRINLNLPYEEDSFSTPPTFRWTNDGGTRNSYAVDFRTSPTGAWYSTYRDVRKGVIGNDYTMPSSLWTKFRRGSRIYWRVRGTDLASETQTVITSDEVYSFYKR